MFDFKDPKSVELTWPLRFRIFAVIAVGIILIGLLAWPMAKSDEPFGIVSLQNLTATELIKIIAASFICGVIGYLVSWPFGREIGILAVPFGLGLLAVRSGSIANLMQLNADVQSRYLIFTRLRFEPFFWLLLVFAGFAGAIVADKLFGKAARGSVDEKEKKQDDAKWFNWLSNPSKVEKVEGQPSKASLSSKNKGLPKSETKFFSTPKTYINSAIAVFGSIITASLGLIVFAQDVRFSDEKLGSVVTQPAVGQIVFAVVVSFGIAGFLVKILLNLGYIWPIIATGFVTAISLIIYANTGTLEYMSGQWPANFFSNPVVSILPIQMVSFGTIGAICGYWTAIRYNYWRHHEM